MALTQSVRQRNVNLTIFDKVKDNFAVGTYLNRVFPQDALADPVALDETNTALRFWVELAILNSGTGMKLPTIMQVDCYYAVGDRGNQATSDRYSDKVTGVADDFINAMSTSDAGFLVVDFSVTPASPTTTDQWLLIKNSRGELGWPESRNRIFNTTGFTRETLTYHIWHHEDLKSAKVYF
jgi:hypothetical protein